MTTATAVRARARRNGETGLNDAYGAAVGLEELLARQHGLASHRQLMAAGVSRATRRERLHRGTWQEVLPAVYLVRPELSTASRELLAALLYGGEGAQLTGLDALRLHGLGHLPPDPYVRILVPHRRQIRPAGAVRVCRTRRLDPDATPFGPFLMVSVVRALADTARCRWWTTADELKSLMRQAFERRFVTTDELAEEIERGPRRHRSLLREALAELP